MFAFIVIESISKLIFGLELKPKNTQETFAKSLLSRWSFRN